MPHSSEMRVTYFTNKANGHKLLSGEIDRNRTSPFIKIVHTWQVLTLRIVTVAMGVMARLQHLFAIVG
jgi:hypothetical protein